MGDRSKVNRGVNNGRQPGPSMLHEQSGGGNPSDDCKEVVSSSHQKAQTAIGNG
jgi:hypothetical protein